ncbi:MAG: hypothetical protein K6E12_07285 [Saccharofermentans sp.]|nr:hypothetical protein [Saccharofermentans sp.]
MKTYNKRGQVAVEAAIAFTIVLILLASVISSIQLYRTDILMRRSVEQTCEKMSLLYPLSVPAADTLSTVLNAFPTVGDGDLKGADTISKVVTVATGLDAATGYNIEELILEGMFARTMEDQIREAFIERNGGSEFFAPDDIEVFFEISESHHIIEVTTDYTVITIAGVRTRSIYSVIPLYGEPILMLNGEDSSSKPSADDDEDDNDAEDNGDSIWSMSNFDRGDAFRELFGANLPKTFPVIDAVNGGEVTAIRSIDLTSPYYQDISHIEKELKEDITSLSLFEPQSAVINGTEYSVDYVDARYLKVVIPENSGEAGKAAVEDLKGYALIHGVVLVIEEYANSNKYVSG